MSERGGQTSDEAQVEKYLEHVRVAKRLATRTVELYALDLARLQSNAQAAGVGLLQVQTAHVRRWVAQMHGGGRSGRGIALILSGWRGFYAWLGREGRIAHNPVADVRAPKSPRPLPKALSVDDAVQLAAYQDGEADPWREARDTALVELLYGGGLRVGELLGLDVVASASAQGWVDAEAGQAHVLGKGGKRRAVPVGAAALQALARWQVQRTGPQAPAACRSAQADTAALFLGPRGQRLTPQSAWKVLRERSLRAGLAAPVHPHMLRHSFASHVLQSSGDLRAVQEMLGHASIATTQVYTRLDFQHLAQAYDAAHPRAKRKG
ncbi:MAG: putative site-specific recombinase [Pseudomonadota bacterium]|jgi:integrase/recombinase XerC